MLGLGIVCMGVEGVGKTSWSLRFPKPLTCLSLGETGYEDLEVIGDVPNGCENFYIESWEDLLKAISSSADRTLVIDSLSGLQALCFDYVTRECYGGNKKKFSAYYTGPRVDSPRYMEELAGRLTELRRKGTNVILLAHTTAEETPNSLGSNYLSVVIDNDKGVRGIWSKWAQAIVFMNVEAKVVDGKAEDKDFRLMYCQKSPGHQAKNRLNLPPVVKMGGSPDEAYENFYKQLPEKVKESLSK